MSGELRAPLGSQRPSLARLLCEDRSPDAVVAIGRRETIGWAGFVGRVGGLADRLTPGARYLLDCADAFGFAVALFGAARSGARLVVPPSRAPGVLEACGQGCDGVIASPDDPAAASGRTIDPVAVASAPGAEQTVLDPDAPLLELGTSGTTGASKTVPKSLRHLDEVYTLEAVLGPALADDLQVIATAPPQHLYGLLFRVLWPLATGRPFGATTWLRPEELLPRIATDRASALVATPVHLRRLAGRPELPALRGRLAAVFSSGGPLDADTAASLAGDLGEAPLEIFGSTETGGVALRRQGTAGAHTHWEPLPGVDLREGADGGRLEVRSPFVSVGSSEPVEGGRSELRFTMGDRVAIAADGRFRLMGRADRTVKIGEKRLSLPEMESRLREHPSVSDAALVTSLQAGEQRSAAVVVPSAVGAVQLADQGRRAATQALGEHLAPAFERVLLPRAFRFVYELPRDARGKTPRAALERLFEDGADGRPRAPVLLDLSETSGRREESLAVPVDLVHFEGHFPGRPIVPGVVRLQWVVQAAIALCGGPLTIRSVEALKFPSVLGPRDRTTLRVEARGDRIRFELARGETVHASGRLVLESPS